MYGQPLRLDQLLRETVERNPLVEAARARVSAARGSRVTAGTLQNPVLTYQVENAAFPGRGASPGMLQETSSFTTIPLEPLWQRNPRVQRADEDVRAAEADLAAVRHQVAGNLARSFFRVSLAQVSARAAADVEEGLDSLVRYTSTRVREGAAAEGDLIRLQVEQDRATTEKVLQQAELAQARAALAPFLNDSVGISRSMEIVVAMDDTLPMGSPILPPANAFLARALASRPDLLAARARARAADAETALQRTLLVRNLGATFGSKRTAGVSSMIAGLSIPFPLFDQNRGEVQRATGERLAVERELVWMERQASAEVAGAYEAAQMLTNQLASLQSRFLSRATEARRIAVAAYQEGAVPLLQVIDATRTLAEARITYYRTLYARHQALLNLYIAAGLDPADALSMTPPSTGSSDESRGATPAAREKN